MTLPCPYPFNKYLLTASFVSILNNSHKKEKSRFLYNHLTHYYHDVRQYKVKKNNNKIKERKKDSLRVHGIIK